MKFVEGLSANIFSNGLLPAIGGLVSRTAYLRKNDNQLYQTWINEIEEIPSVSLGAKSYDLVVMLEAYDPSVLDFFVNNIESYAWVDKLIFVYQGEIPPDLAQSHDSYYCFHVNELQSKASTAFFQNPIIYLHTLGLIEEGWMPELDETLKSNSDLIIVDQDDFDMTSNLRSNPYLKPGFSNELTYDPVYAPILFLDNSLFMDVLKKFKPDTDMAYQFAGALISSAKAPKHLPKVIFHLLQSPKDWQSLESPKIAGNRILDLSSHLSHFPEVYEPVSGLTKVSIIIPIRDQIPLLIECVRSIRKHKYQCEYEIIVLDNCSVETETLDWLEKSEQAGQIRLIKCDFEFNWSKLSNIGIEASDSELIVLLNNDTVVISPEWLDRLTWLAQEKHVGVVGPLLLYPDGTIQHAGIVLGFGGFADHLYMGEPITKRGHEMFISPLVRRNVSACTGACQVFTRQTYLDIGGFNEDLKVSGDLDFSLRALKSGKHNVYDPSVSLYHLESKTRQKGLSEAEQLALKKCIGDLSAEDDEYFNANLSASSRSPLLALVKSHVD